MESVWRIVQKTLLNLRGTNKMNKILTVQIVLLVGLSGGIVGILSGTEIYNNIRESIVITTCLRILLGTTDVIR